MHPIFIELDVAEIEQSTILLGDNMPALSSCKLDTTKGRTKHMDVQVKFLGEVYRRKKFQLHYNYISSQNNWADIFFTKPLATVSFRRLRAAIIQALSTLMNGKTTNYRAINQSYCQHPTIQLNTSSKSGKALKASFIFKQTLICMHLNLCVFI